MIMIMITIDDVGDQDDIGDQDDNEVTPPHFLRFRYSPDLSLPERRHL